MQTFVAAAIFFAWGVLYFRVAEELKAANRPRCWLPNWLRDFFAILKIVGAILLLVGINRPRAAIFGGLLVAGLMALAFVTHFRMKNPPFKAVLAGLLVVCSLVAACLNYRLSFPK